MRMDLHAVGVPSTEERTPEKANTEAKEAIASGH